MTRDAIAVLRQVKESIRNPYVWPGGYPICALMADGDILCIDALRENYRLVAYDMVHGVQHGWRVLSVVVNWRDPGLTCSQTGARIEAAYTGSYGGALDVPL